MCGWGRFKTPSSACTRTSAMMVWTSSTVLGVNTLAGLDCTVEAQLLNLPSLSTLAVLTAPRSKSESSSTVFCAELERKNDTPARVATERRTGQMVSPALRLGSLPTKKQCRHGPPFS